mgnify:CR=1 FL=1
MSYLVDANILSEPTAREPDPRALQWLRDHEPELWIDPVILGEIRFGILLLDKSARRRRLERWFDQGITKIRCLEWDAQAGMCWAQLLANLRRQGQSMPVKDSFIAASALRYNLTLATRNVSDFQYTGISLTNPMS